MAGHGEHELELRKRSDPKHKQVEMLCGFCVVERCKV